MRVIFKWYSDTRAFILLAYAPQNPCDPTLMDTSAFYVPVLGTYVHRTTWSARVDFFLNLQRRFIRKFNAALLVTSNAVP
jgi:hypothetical protein